MDRPQSRLIQPKQPGRGVTIYGSKGSIQLDRIFYKLYDLGGNLIKHEKESAVSKTIDTRGQGEQMKIMLEIYLILFVTISH